MDFLDIEITGKRYIKILIVLIILVIIYLALTMSSLLIFKSYKLGPNTSVEENVLHTHLDVLEISNKKIEIAGWAYKDGEPLGDVNSNYVLRNKETGKMYLMRTKMVENGNIQNEEYKLAGMHAQCLLVGVPKGQYEIMVLYKNGDNDILTSTNIEREIK